MNFFNTEIMKTSAFIGRSTAYKSYTCISIHNNGQWHELFVQTGKLGQYLHDISITPTADYYVSANTFRIDKRKRDSASIFSYRAIVLDIDCHEKRLNPYDYTLFCKTIEQEYTERQDRPYHATFAVRTGRGIQLWFCFEETAGVLGWMYEKVASRIVEDAENRIAAIKNNATEYSTPLLKKATVDHCTTNSAGVFRMPGTYNQKNGSQAKAIPLTEAQELPSLQELFSKVPWTRAEQEQRRNALKRAYKGTFTEPKGIVPNGDIIRNRINFIYYLVVAREGRDGTRDKMLFIFYNNAVQRYDPKEAKHLTERVNAQFKNPLNNAELLKIFRYIDRHGFLKFNNDTLVTFLDCTDHETGVFLRYYRRHTRLRREELKMRNSSAKKGRNNKIIALRKEGKKIREIAEEFSISERTVKRVIQGIATKREITPELLQKLSDDGLSRNEICKAFGISSRTYYRIRGKKTA